MSPANPLNDWARPCIDLLELVGWTADSYSPMALGFTGAQARVGTTTTALACAVAAARFRSAKVLLVDANVYRPDLHNRCGLSLAPGLLQAIDSEIEVADAVQVTSEENLHLLPLGIRSKRRTGSQAEPFAELLKVLLFDYDLLVIDTCSAELYDSSLRLLTVLDSVMLVISPSPDQSLVLQSKNVLLRLNVPLKGVVVGGSD